MRLAGGDTLISDPFNNQVIRVDASGNIVASYGTINEPGFSRSALTKMNGPYGAYVMATIRV